MITNGADAFGLLAQSIGGGGGTDPLLASGAVTTAASGNQINMQIGATGSGSGNNAGTIAMTSNVPLRLDAGETIPDDLDWDEAPLTAAGDGSVGVLGQSIGAGGGNGYLSYNGIFSTGMPKNATVQVGSAAGQSDNGNTVTMNTSGGVITGMHPLNGAASGAYADGILGQSIGGGGGNGLLVLDLGLPTATAALGNVTVNVGGRGVGNGANVAINDINGSVLTYSGYSAAVAAQSIGGGGGNGAANIFGPLKLSPPSKNPAKYTLTIDVGGNGSTGNGAAANITQSGGIIQTLGDGSQGLLAQSIGGGGGTGGAIHSVNEYPAVQCNTYGNNCSVKLVAATVAIGGNASHGSGGVVTISNSGSIATSGEDSSAIVAQSIGGGGGLGGDADVVGGPSLQLTGGGHTITVGGTNGSTGDGNTVNVTDAGAISTSGDNSSGIFAQSIGGGGGVGGLGLGSLWGSGPTVLGGSGNSSGNGGAVNVTVNNKPLSGTKAIYTTGAGAFGIFAQSVGGGGGLAGDISGGVSTTVIGKGSSLTSKTSGGGNGGAVTVVDNGNIKTTGSGADGIFAQSIGGGGGITTGYAGSAGAAGNGGAVSVTQNGIIQTTGNNANAIFAQSAGGTGTGGNVSVTVTGMALAYGANSNGILAQSIGGAGNGNISITVNANSVVQGGTGTGSAGVKMLGGNNNTLVNHGTITTAGSPNAVVKPLSIFQSDAGLLMTAAFSNPRTSSMSLMTDKSSLLSTLTSIDSSSGVAVTSTGGSLTLNNYGNIYGSIAPNGTNLSFTNSGTYVSGSMVNLGTGTLSLASGSVMTPGAGGYVATSNLFGDFDAKAGSDYLVSLDLTNNMASLLNVSGTATLGGAIDLDLLSINAAAPGSHSDTIVNAGTLVNNGVQLAPPQSAVATFNLGWLQNALQLNYDINYAPQSGRVLSSNDLSFGNYIGAIQTAGGTPELSRFMTDVFTVPTVPKLKTLYDRFTPGASTALGSSAFLSTMQFSDEILGCHSDGIVSTDGNCNWARLGSEASHESATFSSVGYGRNAYGFATGFEHRTGANTSIGAAIHYSKGSLFDGESGSSLSGDSLEVGVSASRVRHDGIVISSDLLAGRGRYDSVRQIGYPSLITTATASQPVSYIGAHLRAERRFGGQLKAVTPFLEAGATSVNAGAIFEHGAGNFNEHVLGYHAIYPTIGAGVRLEDSKRFGSTTLHGALDFAVTQLVGNPQTSTSATLQGARAGIAPFGVSNTLDRTFLRIGPSLELTRRNNASVRIGASYNVSRHTNSGGAYIELTLSH
ncbi:MAG TPA: autotransporter outer membrane beta-barrel domain-containing protein [Candidatus Baltobacteraceae bacterium]|nr:autotransporter outer membrane beta-barrel domain-containing protein [Candidatus Baltobacteraceae bacterium]